MVWCNCIKSFLQLSNKFVSIIKKRNFDLKNDRTSDDSLKPIVYAATSSQHMDQRKSLRNEAVQGTCATTLFMVFLGWRLRFHGSSVFHLSLVLVCCTLTQKNVQNLPSTFLQAQVNRIHSQISEPKNCTMDPTFGTSSQWGTLVLCNLPFSVQDLHLLEIEKKMLYGFLMHLETRMSIMRKCN